MKKIYQPIAILVLIFGIGAYFQSDLEKYFFQLIQKTQEVKSLAVDGLESEFQKKVIAPPPLRSEKESAFSNLTKAGVIERTNAERKNNNRSTLRENHQLDKAAEMKLEDMFQKQYFDHISPDGKGPAELAEKAEYEYIIVGENLALGNFQNDADLVRAWMESPGHRENILNSGFSEIGVAVKKGNLEEKTVWLAVQEFGRPLSECPKADIKLKKQIEKDTKDAESLKKDLLSLRNEIKNSQSSEKNALEKIKEYNKLVRKYNRLVDETKDLISSYNQQVKDYNDCVSQ